MATGDGRFASSHWIEVVAGSSVVVLAATAYARLGNRPRVVVINFTITVERCAHPRESDDPERQVREAAARALAGRSGKDVTAALLARLDDPEHQVREAA